MLLIDKNKIDISNIRKIINKLSTKEKEYIGNGYWVDSDHVIYRKIKYLDKEPVAFIDVYLLPKYKRTGLIIIAATKESRGKGIAKSLVNSAISNLKNNKEIDALRWLADYDNLPSINLAKSLGFEYKGKTKDNCIEFIYNFKREME